MAGNRKTARTFLANEIRRARETKGPKGMSRAALAKELFVSDSLIAKWESGRQVPDEEQLTALVKVLDFGPDIVKRIREELVSGEISPEWSGKWRPIESKANTLYSAEHSTVPGLLQTPDYARAVLEHNNHSPIDIEEQIQERLKRQSIFERENPPTAVFIMDEQALHKRVGTAQTMIDQMEHLLNMAEQPNIHILIIPHDSGYHVGLVGGFIIAKFDGAEIAYQDGTLRGQVLDQYEDVSELFQIWENVRDLALTRKASREFIAKVAEQWKNI